MDTPSRQPPGTEPGAPTSAGWVTFEQLTRLMLKVSADFCEIDLFNSERSLRSSQRPVNRMTLVRPTGEAKRRPRWVLFVKGLYLFITARTIVYICLQYMYDCDWYEYERLRGCGIQPAATLNSSCRSNATNTIATNANYSEASHQLQVLEQRIERDIGRLKFVGAPLIKFHFGIELVYIYLTWAVFVLYFRSQLYFRYIRPFDVSLLRAVVDWKREQLHCDRLVRHEVSKFCISNWAFVTAQLHRSSAKRHDSRSTGFFKSKLLLENLSQTCDQLNRMAVDGSLKPPNRSLAWVKRLSHSMGYFSFCVLAGHIVLMASIFILLPQSQWLEISGIETDPMDMLFIFETLVFAAIEVISVNFYICASAFNIYDQIRTVNELNKLIECCIRHNTRTLERFQADCGQRLVSSLPSDHSATQMSDAAATATAETVLELSITRSRYHQEEDVVDERTARRDCYAEMNKNMLFVMMNYKIFVSQTKSARSFTALTMFMTAELVTLLPVCGLISAQYLTTSMLYILVGLCVLFTILSDISLAPCCHFNSRHLKTYRSLHSLLAHTVATTSRAAAGSNKVQIYDRHTILILRKELSEPDLLLKQFAISLLGIHFSYTNFLKIHFWCGILTTVGYYASGPNKGGIFERTIKFF